ncbi:unnamed protein product [Soboliphyme baturini]|uniref:J domain-containing protein n=1 Tax=Soboliphyme baturini TaxID=241478 RepID=A0A183J4C2_9BILA|nr:unnamed protein product [Soboliphyme baturini]
MIRRCSCLIPRFAKTLSSQKPNEAEKSVPFVEIKSSTSAPSSEIHCWKCHMVLDCFKEQFFCGNCEYIQPPKHCYNYFKFFGIPVSYRLDKQLLTARFHELQQKLHPDRFTKKSKVSAWQPFVTMHRFALKFIVVFIF